MSTCSYLDERDQARAALARLGGQPEVIAADLITPDSDPLNRWTVEIAIEGDITPPAVLGILAEEGLSVHNVGPRAEWATCVAVV